MSRLTVVGLGLLGGSFAAAQRLAEPGLEVTGIDHRDVLELPRAQSLAQHSIDTADEPACRLALERADLVFVATPVSAIVGHVARYVESAKLITDCASTKRHVSEAADAAKQRSHFVPGHPMAGAAMGGVESARADLFVGQTWILCPELASAQAVKDVERWIARTGAKVVHLDADAHDRAVAVTSHVPQLLASALAVLGREQGADLAAGPVFRELTRTAGGPLSIWRDIFDTNRDNVGATLRTLTETLTAIQAELSNPKCDLAEIERLLGRARRE